MVILQSKTSNHMTITEAALLLHVNRITIRRWIKQGKLHSEKVGQINLLLKANVLAIAHERGINVGIEWLY